MSNKKLNSFFAKPLLPAGADFGCAIKTGVRKEPEW